MMATDTASGIRRVGVSNTPPCIEVSGDQVRWLVTGAGIIGGILGTRLMDSGEDVLFLVRRDETRDALRDRGLEIVDRSTGERRHLAVRAVTPAEIRKPVDVVLVTLRRDSIDRAFFDSVERAVGGPTQVVPMFSCFDLPQEMEAQYGSRCRVIGYPTGVGGWRGRDETEIVAVVPERGMNVVLGPTRPSCREDARALARVFRRAGIRTWTSSEPIQYPRLAAAFLVAFAAARAGDARPTTQALGDDAAVDRILEELREVSRTLRRSRRDLPVYVEAFLRTPRTGQRFVLRRILSGPYGDGMDRFLETGGGAEAQALARDLQAIEATR